MKKPKGKIKKGRTHIPPLKPDRLEQSLKQLETLPISASEKAVLADILKAAANPQSEDIHVIIASLPAERRQLIEVTVKELGAITAGVMARGRKALEDMSEDEWQALVDE